eukprot:g31908.t2
MAQAGWRSVFDGSTSSLSGHSSSPPSHFSSTTSLRRGVDLEKGIGSEEVYQDVLDLFVYSRLPFLILVGFCAEMESCGYRAILVLGAASGVLTAGHSRCDKGEMPRLNFHVLLVTCASVKLCTAWPTRGVLTAGDEPEPQTKNDTEYRPFSWCEVWELIVPVCLSLFGGWSFVYLVMSFMAKGQEDKAVLAMPLDLEGRQRPCRGKYWERRPEVFCMFILYPEIWRYRGLSVMLAGFTTQCVGAVTFGLCGLGNVYMGASGRSFDVVVLLARFLQGTGGGLQVAFGLMQTALLLTGLERSIQNTRSLQGTGPLLSSLSTSSARLAHCISKPGYEATFAVCTLLPLIQLPMLRWAPKRVHGRGSASQGSSAQYCYQRMLVIILCVILQSIRSFSSAAVEAALSQLLYTDYQLTRRWTGVITAALMFTMLPAQIFYEQLGRRFSVNRVIRFLLLMALVGSSLNLFESWLGLVASACLVLPSLALSSGLIMGTMQVHQIPNSYIFDLIRSRRAIASGGQHGFGEQQLLVSAVCIVLYEAVHVLTLEKQGDTKRSEEAIS